MQGGRKVNEIGNNLLMKARFGRVFVFLCERLLSILVVGVEVITSSIVDFSPLPTDQIPPIVLKTTP